MSELITKLERRRDFRGRLLSTVSMLTLLAAVYGAPEAMADENVDRPTVWIELGGQLEQVDGTLQPFVPPFESEIVAAGLTSSSVFQRQPKYSHGGEGSISFEPQGSDWIFTANVRYGRSNGNKQIHEQTPPHDVRYYGTGGRLVTSPIHYQKFSNTTSEKHNSDNVIDFQVGKDVGLGFPGHDSRARVQFGLRIAQFSSRSTVALDADPDLYNNDHIFKYAIRHRHLYSAFASNSRSFRGIGPSLSWNSATLLVGNSQSAELNLDWGLNGAVLFGRQNAVGLHRSASTYFRYVGAKVVGLPHGYLIQPTINPAVEHNRVRSVIVPNAGGFAGFSVHYSNAKVSLGYRADFFFGAMDGGIDIRKSEVMGFYGPFATISFGLGG